jgi:hypothetical protein
MGVIWGGSIVDLYHWSNAYQRGDCLVEEIWDLGWGYDGVEVFGT